MTPYYFRPLSAPFSPLQPLTGGGGVQPVGAAGPGQGSRQRARARWQQPQANGRHDQRTACTHYIANRMCMLQLGSHVLTSYRLLPILTTY